MSLELAVESVSRDRRDGSETTAIAMKDKHYPFFVTLFYKTYDDCEVIETWTEISHTEKKPVTLYRFASAYMPVRRGDTWLTHFHGTWGAECYLHEEPLTDGMKVLKNKDGVRNTQRDNPSLMISLDGRPRELTGHVIGGTLAWAGNYRIALDNDNTHTTHLFAGINEEQSQYTLQPREVFTTPVFAFTFSDEGKSGVSRNIHRWARLHRLNHGTELRDVLLNSWEGVYFKVNQEGMDRMMADLADLGGELFVMDDGWFGDKYPRNNGETSLGDWTVCREKLPQGIEGLTESARKHGVKFGIWIEPEMTNTRSELYEKHPDWVIQQPYRENRKGRGGTQQARSVEPRGAGVRLQRGRPSDDRASRHRLHQVGRQHDALQLRLDLPAGRPAIAPLHRVPPRHGQGAAAHPGEISPSGDAVVRQRRRPGQLWRPALLR